MLPSFLPALCFSPPLCIPAELIAEQIVTLEVIGHCHIVGAFVPFPFHGYLHVDRTNLWICDGSLGVGDRFGHVLAVGYLGSAPFDPGHVWAHVGRGLPIVGETEDQTLDRTPELL